MPREKQYKEEEVIEKAMGLFWKNGYRNTSLRMLSKEMGINQFSINASFGNKQKLFLESLKLYRSKLQKLINVFENSSNGIESIKHFFYQFAEFADQNNSKNGCLMINTMSEFGLDIDKKVGTIISNYEEKLRTLFKHNLQLNSTKDNQTIERHTNYLVLALSGLALATKIQNEITINDYIETTFQHL